jgi:hypothetical protein
MQLLGFDSVELGLTLFKIFIQHRLTGWFEEGFKQAMQMCVH